MDPFWETDGTLGDFGTDGTWASPPSCTSSALYNVSGCELFPNLVPCACDSIPKLVPLRVPIVIDSITAYMDSSCFRYCDEYDRATNGSNGLIGHPELRFCHLS